MTYPDKKLPHPLERRTRNAELELQIWKEACRPMEIGEAIERVLQRLRGSMPIGLVLFRSVDLKRQRLETVASASVPGVVQPGRARTECHFEDMERLMTWCRMGRVRMGLAGSGDPLIDLVAPEGTRGVVLVGPLSNEEGCLGAVVLAAEGEALFEDEQVEMLTCLLEPFSVALEHSKRLHELARLREAVEADNRALLSRLQRQDIVDGVVGAESGLKAVMERVEQVAPTDVPVLILGETGSGKEVVARAIHQRSRRVSGPVVRVNCGAIPPELIDSELFGHERGSFTGAVATHKGWFERADGGTLFLDEVAELPLAAQVRLLRILQDGSFERVGAQRSMTVDVRVVAATHRDMQALVGEGRFREDLWYRISVFPIRLPPLRERPEDLPQLAAHFAWKAGKRLGAGPLVPSAQDMELLLAYPWPGNVRELASVIERAAILGNGRELKVAAALGTNTPRASLLIGEPTTRATLPASAPSLPPLIQEPEPLQELDEVMRRHIEDALKHTLGRIEGPFGAALKLGINPHTLRARMRKLGIEWKNYRPGR